MARPRIFDYDTGSDETIVTEGVEGAEPRQIAFDLSTPRVTVICAEGTLNATGDGLETITRDGGQEDFFDSDATDFYVANKAAIDSILSAAMELWADRRSKTGTVVES